VRAQSCGAGGGLHWLLACVWIIHRRCFYAALPAFSSPRSIIFTMLEEYFFFGNVPSRAILDSVLVMTIGAVRAAAAPRLAYAARRAAVNISCMATPPPFSRRALPRGKT
jgi:hypothetical protein